MLQNIFYTAPTVKYINKHQHHLQEEIVRQYGLSSHNKQDRNRLSKIEIHEMGIAVANAHFEYLLGVHPTMLDSTDNRLSLARHVTSHINTAQNKKTFRNRLVTKELQDAAAAAARTFYACT